HLRQRGRAASTVTHALTAASRYTLEGKLTPGCLPIAGKVHTGRPPCVGRQSALARTAGRGGPAARVTPDPEPGEADGRASQANLPAARGTPSCCPNRPLWRRPHRRPQPAGPPPAPGAMREPVPPATTSAPPCP